MPERRISNSSSSHRLQVCCISKTYKDLWNDEIIKKEKGNVKKIPVLLRLL